MTSNPATPNLAFVLKISLTTLALCLCLLVASPALGQQEASFQKRFTNQDIIDMAKLGLSEDVIIAKIRAATASNPESVRLDTSIEALGSLKAANVPDSVIKVMINPTPPPAAVVAGANPMIMDPNLPPPEVGVYWKNGGKFILVEGRAVTNTKTGGKAGTFSPTDCAISTGTPRSKGLFRKIWFAITTRRFFFTLMREQIPRITHSCV